MFCQEGNYPLEFIKTFAPFIYDIVFPFLLAFLLVKYTKLHSKSFDILILFQMRLFFPIGDVIILLAVINAIICRFYHRFKKSLPDFL